MMLTNETMFDSLTVLSQAEEKGMLGYAIAVNRRKIASEVKEWADLRDHLIRKYGTDQGNGQFSMSHEAAAQFLEELKPYSDITAEVSVMQVTPEVFCGGNLTSQQMFTLGWMVKE